MIRIGLDFGGTKIEAAALDPQDGYLHRIRRPNPGAYDLAVSTVRDLVAELEAELGQKAPVGIGCPGSLSPSTGLIRNSNSLYLNGRPFREDLCQALERDVRLANDANCLALSEATDGAAAGVKVAFAVILGTGCGAGLVVDGTLIEGRNNVAGEWGHIPLPWAKPEEFPGPQCWCGLRGCLEKWVSGTGLSLDHQTQTDQTLSAEMIVDAMRRGDADASSTFDRLIDRLGRALALTANIIDPDVIVIGGGLSNVEEIYARLPQAIRPYVFGREWDAIIAPAQWGDSSGVRGAARLHADGKD